jgi:hypothetical protein
MMLSSLLFASWLALASDGSSGVASQIVWPDAAAVRLSSPLPKCGAGYGRALPLLSDGPGYARSEESVSHGSALLIEGIRAVAAAMSAGYPDTQRILVGRLNQPGGARNKYLMHQDGLDGDVGIYTLSGEQAGFGREATPQTLDKEHTWAEIQRFFATGKVMWILLDQSLIDTLHAWLVSSKQLTPEQAARTFPGPGYQGFLAGETVMHASGHKNHMHVHMKCVE